MKMIQNVRKKTNWPFQIKDAISTPKDLSDLNNCLCQVKFSSVLPDLLAERDPKLLAIASGDHLGGSIGKCLWVWDLPKTALDTPQCVDAFTSEACVLYIIISSYIYYLQVQHSLQFIIVYINTVI